MKIKIKSYEDLFTLLLTSFSNNQNLSTLHIVFHKSLINFSPENEKKAEILSKMKVTRLIISVI